MTTSRRFRRAWSSLVLLGIVACSGDAGPTDPVDPNGPGEPNGQAGSFFISLQPSAIAVARGESRTVNVSLARAGGFDGIVSLEATGLPGGVTAVFEPATTVGGVSSLALSVPVGASTGTFPITIRGTGGAQAATVERQLALEVTSAATPPLPAPGNVTVDFCGSSGIPLWSAFRDGDGPWTPAGGGSTQVSFQLDHPVGGVAWVVPAAGRYRLEVLYGTRDQLVEWGGERCDEGPAFGRTVSAEVTGVNRLSPGSAPQVALSSLGWVIPFDEPVPGPHQVTFEGVAPGPVDLIAGRSTVDLATFTTVPDRVILRRGLDPLDGSVLDSIDFEADEAFSPAMRALEVAGVGGGEIVIATTMLRTSHGFGALGAAVGASPSWYGLPGDRLQAGDLHIVGASATTLATGQGGPPAPNRSALAMTGLPVDLSLALGPHLSQPVVQTLPASGHVRARAEISFQAEYDRLWIADFEQPGGPWAGRHARIQVTDGYLDSGLGTVSLEVPDFAGVGGWTPNWGLRPGSVITWTVTGLGWDDPGGVLLPPWTDGSGYLTASLSGTITP